MGKKGLLLIDGAKNAVVLNVEELEAADLSKYLRRNGIRAEVRKHKTRAELNKSIGQYLANEWEEGEPNEV